MKTPGDIKGGMMAHVHGYCTKEGCPYFRPAAGCCDEMLKDALTYIEGLEADLEAFQSVAASPGAVEDLAIENNRLTSRVAELEKRLADMNASPFDGGMSQAEYFNGRRAQK